MTYESTPLFPLRLRNENMSDFLVSFVNTFQRHRSCREGVCLPHNKKTKDVRYRYYFPRQLLEAAGVTMNIDGKSWKFAPKRNKQSKDESRAGDKLDGQYRLRTGHLHQYYQDTEKDHHLMVIRAPSRSTTYLQSNAALHPEIYNNN